MIDKVLSKVDPAKFLMMIEKLNDALPPPGQSVLQPFIVVLKQACEIKAQLQVRFGCLSIHPICVSPATTCAHIRTERKKLTNTQGKVEQAKAQIGTVQSAKGSFAEARMTPEGVEMANVNDVKLDVDGSPPQTGVKVTWIIIGCVC
jgi:hypothetical protein